MSRAALLLGFLLAGTRAGDGGSGSAAGLFAAGNAHYQKGEFRSAEESYRRLLEAGYRSGTIYFNLGNACFKQKKLGEAIYFWEKARHSMPADRESAENLELANLLVVDRIEVPPDPLALRWLDGAVHVLDPAQEAWIILLLWTAAHCLFGLRWLARSGRLRTGALAGSLAAASLLVPFAASLSWKVYEQHYRREGVVVAQKAEIRSGPGPENVTVFTVHEGTRVRLRGETAGWYQVSLANGWTGWLEAGAVRVL